MTRRGRLIERVERGGGQKRWAADRAGRERRRRNKEGRPMCGARGAEAKERGAADGAGREERRLNKKGRPMGRGQ